MIVVVLVVAIAIAMLAAQNVLVRVIAGRKGA
jgi:hypothetical protein